MTVEVYIAPANPVADLAAAVLDQPWSPPRLELARQRFDALPPIVRGTATAWEYDNVEVALRNAAHAAIELEDAEPYDDEAGLREELEDAWGVLRRSVDLLGLAVALELGLPINGLNLPWFGSDER